MKNEMKYFQKMKELSDEELQEEFNNVIEDGKPYYVIKSLIIQQVQRARV